MTAAPRAHVLRARTLIERALPALEAAAAAVPRNAGGMRSDAARAVHYVVRSIVEQCRNAGAEPFVKQLGAAPYQIERDRAVSLARRPGGGMDWRASTALRDAKGGDWSEWPKDLRVREFPAAAARACRACGCTDADCRGCIQRTGHPCLWVEQDLCSACVPAGVVG